MKRPPSKIDCYHCGQQRRVLFRHWGVTMLDNQPWELMDKGFYRVTLYSPKTGLSMECTYCHMNTFVISGRLLSTY